MLKLTQLDDEPAVCRHTPLGVMLLSYAELCRTDGTYCRFYRQDDAAVLLQNGSAAVVCADDRADFDEIRRLAGFTGCRTLLCEKAGLSDQHTALIRCGVNMIGRFEPSEEPIVQPQTTAEYRAVYELTAPQGVAFDDWFADVNLRQRRGAAKVAVVVENGEIVATASVLHRAKNGCVIGAVATKAAARGRGLAGALVRRLCERTTYLLCLPELESFYRRLGFTVCGHWYEYELKG